MTRPETPRRTVAEHSIAKSIETAGGFTHSDSTWAIKHSDFSDYTNELRLNDGTNVATYIFDNIRPADIGLDIAGGTDGNALRQLLDANKLRHGIVTNYQDHRSDRTRNDSRLDHISGNLLMTTTWQEIMDRQMEHAPAGFGLVLHRPVAPLQNLTPRFYSDAADLILSMVRPGGLFFTQIPDIIRQKDCQMVKHELTSRGDVTAIHPTYGRYNRVSRYVVIQKV